MTDAPHAPKDESADMLSILLARALRLEPALLRQVAGLAAVDKQTGAIMSDFFQAAFEDELRRAFMLGYDVGMLSVDLSQLGAPKDEVEKLRLTEAIESIIGGVREAIRKTDWIAQLDQRGVLVVVLPGCGEQSLQAILKRVQEELKKVAKQSGFIADGALRVNNLGIFKSDSTADVTSVIDAIVAAQQSTPVKAPQSQGAKNKRAGSEG
jgi:GGDEF domain-containing protein